MVAKEKLETPPPIILTKQAIDQVKKAIKREQQGKGTGLRVRIVQGANGYRYDIVFDNKEDKGDHLSIQDGVKIFVDSITAASLAGTKLDFQKISFGDQDWGGFVFHRPSQDD